MRLYRDICMFRGSGFTFRGLGLIGIYMYIYLEREISRVFVIFHFPSTRFPFWERPHNEGSIIWRSTLGSSHPNLQKLLGAP